jgi:hypothetical protein
MIYKTKLLSNTITNIREASLPPVYLTTPLYVLDIKKANNLTDKTKA